MVHKHSFNSKTRMQLNFVQIYIQIRTVIVCNENIMTKVFVNFSFVEILLTIYIQLHQYALFCCRKKIELINITFQIGFRITIMMRVEKNYFTGPSFKYGTFSVAVIWILPLNLFKRIKDYHKGHQGNFYLYIKKNKRFWHF